MVFDLSPQAVAEMNEIAWPCAFLSGGAFPLHPLNLADAIRTIGGMQAVLPLLARAATPSAFCDALVLVGALLHQNPKNMREMSRIQVKGNSKVIVGVSVVVSTAASVCSPLSFRVPLVAFSRVPFAFYSSSPRLFLSRPTRRLLACLLGISSLVPISSFY